MIEAIKLIYPNAVAIEWNPDKPDVALVDGVQIQVTQEIKDAQALESKKSLERVWRDSELKGTDLVALQASLGELGRNTQAIKAYRQALRDYPQQPDFPNGTRPVMG